MSRSERSRSRSAILCLFVLGAGLGVAADATGEEPCDPVQEMLVPRVAARDGTPFAVGFVPSPCFASAFDELRVWAGNETTQASRMFDGATWASSIQYRDVALFPVHAGAVWVPVQAAPGATHGPVLVTAAAEAEVWLRVRPAGGAPTTRSLGSVLWVDAEDVRGHWGDPTAPVLVVGSDSGGLLAAAPAAVAADGTALPPGFAWLAVPPEAPPSPPAPVRPGEVLLVRVAPALRPEGSMFELHVAGTIADLSGLRVRSRGGSLIVPELNVTPGTVVRFADAADAAVAPLPAHVPDFSLEQTIHVTWGDADAASADLRAEKAGAFRLARSGGSLELVYGDVVLDSFVYGEGAPPEVWGGSSVEATRIIGRVYLRAWDAAGFLDSDAAADWERARVHRQHQSDVSTRWFDVEGPVRVFACPDRCLEEYLLRVDAAVSTIDVNLYDLTLVEAVEGLARAAERGVVVRVVVDERPVGAGPQRMDRIAWGVDRLVAAGAEVFAMGRERFDVNHAKYVVVDDAWTLVFTENAVKSGWPPDGVSGNRGYGVAVHDAALAEWVSGVFEADALHDADARRVEGRDLHPDAQGLAPVVAGASFAVHRLPTLVLDGGFPVAPLLAPDHLADPARHPLADLIAASRNEVGFQQLNLPLEWRRPGFGQESPLVAALAAAADGGVWVNATVAGAFVEEGRDGNDVTAAALTAYSARMDVRLAGAPHPDGVLHAKVWWGDPGTAQGWLVVGSANGNLASQALNRELSLGLLHPEAAAYVAGVAAGDHAAASPVLGAPSGPAEGSFTAIPAPPVFALLVFVAAGLVASRARRP